MESKFKVIVLQREGICNDCGGTLKAGEEARYYPANERRGAQIFCNGAHKQPRPGMIRETPPAPAPAPAPAPQVRESTIVAELSQKLAETMSRVAKSDAYLDAYRQEYLELNEKHAESMGRLAVLESYVQEVMGKVSALETQLAEAKSRAKAKAGAALV